MDVPTTLPARAAVAPQHRWNAESVYADVAAWKADLEQAQTAIPELAAYQGRLSEGAATLKTFLSLAETIQRRVGKVYFYAVMTTSCDTTDSAATAMVGQASAVYGQLTAAAAFTDPELLAIGRETLDAWMAADAELAQYAHYVDDLFRRQAHVRSAEVEAVIGLSVDALNSIEEVSEMLTNADLQFRPAVASSGEQHTVSQGTLHGLYNQPDRVLRRSAYESYTDGYLSLKQGLAANYAVALKRDVFFARARRYNSSLEAALFANHVPVGVFHNLIDTYKRFLPTWHKYWRVRREALGQSDIQPYDVWAPIAAQQPQVTYERAVEMIAAGMRPLGDEYVSILRRGCLEDRWVDVYPNVGKRQGAFSYGTPDTHPFIMMSFQDNLQSMSTLAHELGHSMHSYHTWRAQPYVNSGYSLFVAEVASNFNQALVRAHLLQTETDRDFQIALLEEALYNFHRYFFVMPTLARFELEMHERVERGEGLNDQIMNERMADLFAEGYGSEMQYERERIGITWATFGHLYANFYVFQYATGISAAHALADRVLTEGEAAAADYLRFLSAGGSLYPLDALQVAGVDMNTPAVVEKTFGVLASYVDRLEALTRRA